MVRSPENRGHAILWFIGVVRDGLGRFEDKFFASVFLGSGLLFLAMIFVSSAVGVALVASRGADYGADVHVFGCLLYTSPSPRDRTRSRMPSSA